MQGCFELARASRSMLVLWRALVQAQGLRVLHLAERPLLLMVSSQQATRSDATQRSRKLSSSPQPAAGSWLVARITVFRAAMAQLQDLPTLPHSAMHALHN